MAAVSQWEREAIGERTRDALRHKRNKGERVGNIAFGSRIAQDGEHLEPDPGEQAALAEIRRLRGQGATLRGIAADLNRRDLRTRRGTPWRLESVARIVKQTPILAGLPSGQSRQRVIMREPRAQRKSKGSIG
jgi:site-specific DNA recombinase